MTCFRQNHQVEDLDESMKLLEEATLHPFSSLIKRLEIAVGWANVARSQGHHTTFKAYEVALSLLQRALIIGPTLQRRHDLLVGKSSYLRLTLDAASYAIKKGDIPKAIEMLEQGRSLLRSQLHGFRTPLDKLSEINKPLADRFRDTSNRLEALSMTSKSHDSTFDGDNHSNGILPGGRLFYEMLSRRRRLPEEQESIIQEIQRLPGFSDFLKPTPFEKLRQAAKEGPVIVINLSEYNSDSDCLIVFKDSDPVRIPLTGLNAPEQLSYLRIARKQLRKSPAEYDNALRSTMEWLWKNVICLVVEKLDELGIEKQSRIWLCPTSAPTFLPIHAAGPYRNERSNSLLPR